MMWSLSSWNGRDEPKFPDMFQRRYGMDRVGKNVARKTERRERGRRGGPN
jgi:hypothetical protein